jgi:cysteine desulfurase
VLIEKIRYIRAMKLPKTISSKTRQIYLDYASLTPIDSRVLRVINKYSLDLYANPYSWYKQGVSAKKALDEARKEVADFLGAHTDEIIFTAGGTEANNIAIQGVVKAYENGFKPHVVVSAIEHSSVLETVRFMEQRHECEVTRIPVDEFGLVDLDALKKSIKQNTVLVSVMAVNNEIGTIQPIREIAKIIRQARAKFGGSADGNVGGNVGGKSMYPLFHTDAAQAGLYLDLNVEQLGVDLLTLDGGKVCGPRGVGALFVRRNIFISPIMSGGGQEKGLRSGTENLSLN